jgi:hypothetical protein
MTTLLRRTGLLLLLLLPLIGVLPAGRVAAANGTYYVGSTADTQRASPDCTSAMASDCTLREAVAAAASGTDTIRFRAVVDGQPIVLTSTITLATGVTIVGNGAAKTIIENGSGDSPRSAFSVRITGGAVPLSGMTIRANGLTAISNYGAGTVSVADSTISGGDYGIANVGNGTVTATGSVFANNSKGGIANDSGTVAVTNSTFSGNANGIYEVGAGPVIVTNSTFWGNMGAIYQNIPGPMMLANTIVAGSTGSNCLLYSITDNGHNLEYGTSGAATSCGFTTGSPKFDVLADPKLGPLQDNGGPTPTMALLSNSAAIDAGGDARNFCPLQDQRGATRPQGGAACDIGAFEAGTIITTTTLAASPNPAAFGQPVTLTATVAGVLAASSFAASPGVVTFTDGAATLGTATPDASGSAVFTTSNLSAGSHPIAATYGGNANYAGSIGTLAGGQVVGPAPALSIDSVRQNEGNSGTTPFTFTVTLSSSSSQTITVAYATADGTAMTADNDYQAASGTLTFAPGVTAQTITVLVGGDTKNETDETFTVTLSGATVATIAQGMGVGTIVDDDPVPALSIGDVHLSAGSSGTTPFVFPVTLAQASGQTITVWYATADGTATVAENDYQATSGTLTFAPGDTSKSITVTVTGSATTEADETFAVTLSNATNATVARAIGTGTITNQLIITSLSPPSGSAAGGGSVTITGAGFGADPAQVTVTFGTTALVTSVTPMAITVTTPAHAAGTVDVTVTVNGVSATKAGAYTYGTVTPLPPPQQPGSGAGTAPNSLPATRPPGMSAPGGSPHSLPPAR